MKDDAPERDTNSAALPQADSLLEMLDLDERAGAACALLTPALGGSRHPHKARGKFIANCLSLRFQKESNMSEAERIKVAFERIAEAISRRPSLGHGTGVSKIRVNSGLKCEIREGPWHLTADMPEQAGGNGSAPTPGVLGRAALGSCLAIAYMMYAAKMGVPIAGLEVEIQADYDDGALFGVSTVPAGYSEVRYIVTVESNAPEGDILRVLNEADRHDPYLDVFARAQQCRREVRISPPENK